LAATIKLKMVRVDDEVHKRLTEVGKYGESLSDIIKRVLDELEECKKSKK
jgi:predicted CopG family antitoxin